jgi:hypothetical protein
MTEDELFESDNWFDYGLSSHIESNMFPHWADVGREMARIAGCEEGSPMYALFLQTAAAASKLGFDCDYCDAIPKPLDDHGRCPKCAAEGKK